MKTNKTTLLLGTRKGLIIFKKVNGEWQFQEDHFLGIPVSYAFEDERTGIWWVGLDHGHWGCKLHFSKDQGQNWSEVSAPAYPEGELVREGKVAKLEYIWTIQAGHADHPQQLYLGTDPGGLFVSEDGGATFSLQKGLWEHPSRKKQWFGAGRDNAGIHSILIDPDDEQHIFVGISVAGVFETTDGGTTWHPRNRGTMAEFLPDPSSEVGQDPHLLVAHPDNFQHLWQQNHCGIYRSTDGGANWIDISEAEGPANFGFAIALDEEDLDTAWVIPGISDQKRVAIDHALCVCRTIDGGKTWQRLHEGLPQNNCYDIVYRHGLDLTGDTLAFGTTTGNAYLSADRGDTWQCLSYNLPMIYSLRFAE